MKTWRGARRPTTTGGRFPAIVLLCAAAVTLLLSCGDDSQPTAPDTGTTGTTGTTEVAAPPPTDTPQPTAPDTARRLDIDGETTWQEVFDTFAASEQSCSREALGGERLHSLLEQRVVEGDMDGGEWSLFSCLESRDAGSLLLSALIAGIEWDEGLVLDAAQRACLQEWISGFNWAALDDTEDPAAFGTLMTGAVNCLPDLFLTDILDEMGLRPDELSTEQRACLQEWISGFNWAALDDDPTALAALAMGPAICLADEDTDDHANLHSGASTAAIGEPTDGTLDYDGDVDVFVFEAQQERIYEIHVTPGTLEDPTLELSDADGAFLDYNDDYGGSLASRLAWRAPASGDYYLSVGGFGTGSYTLTVTISDITDDTST